MTSRGTGNIGTFMRYALAGIMALSTLLPALPVQAQSSGDRSLYLHYTHTKETKHIVFKRNGRFVQSALDELNVFLRDWRRNEPARMDPALFDLLWEVYQQTGSNQPIHIVSAYRAPATNAMLASNSSGVASNSQHMAGKAIDFYIPGVSASRLREIGFRMQVGGVGFYPSSGTPFVHLDTGSVRAWPRMTTAQLQQIFPDGRTMHIPSNGVPISQQGYQQAKAEWDRCHRVPCNAGAAPGSGGTTQVADSGPRRSLLDFFTGGGNNEPAPQPATSVAAAQPAPAQRAVTSVPVSAAPQQVAAAPTPPVRPAALGAPATPQNIPFAIVDAEDIEVQVAALTEPAEALAAPVPPSMSRTMADLRANTPSAFAPSSNEGTLAIAALDQSPAPTPQPRPQFSPAVVASAYAPAGRAAEEPRVETASLAPAPMRPALATSAPSELIDADMLETASFSPQMGLESFADLFSGPILPRDGVPDTATANALASLSTREGELFAPDLDHVTDVFTAPVALSSAHFAFMTEPDNSDFDPATGLGQRTPQFAFTETVASTGAAAASSIWVRLQQ